MGNILLLVQLLLQYSDKIAQVGAILKQAHAEGRDVTDAELAAAGVADDEARARLQAAIDAAKAAESPAPTDG